MTGIPEGEEQEQRIENLFEKLMIEVLANKILKKCPYYPNQSIDSTQFLSRYQLFLRTTTKKFQWNYKRSRIFTETLRKKKNIENSGYLISKFTTRPKQNGAGIKTGININGTEQGAPK